MYIRLLLMSCRKMLENTVNTALSEILLKSQTLQKLIYFYIFLRQNGVVNGVVKM